MNMYPVMSLIYDLCYDDTVHKCSLMFNYNFYVQK